MFDSVDGIVSDVYIIKFGLKLLVMNMKLNIYVYEDFLILL